MPLLAASRSPHARLSRATEPEPEREPPIPVPPGMSEWAARWLFGDEPVEGIPFSEGAALAQRPAAPAARAAAATAPAAPEARPLARRGTVDEVHGIRLSRTPAPIPTEPVAQPANSLPPATEPLETPPTSEAHAGRVGRGKGLCLRFARIRPPPGCTPAYSKPRASVTANGPGSGPSPISRADATAGSPPSSHARAASEVPQEPSPRLSRRPAHHRRIRPLPSRPACARC